MFIFCFSRHWQTLFFFQLITIYAPNILNRNECENFFEEIDTYLKRDTPTILCGDFNMVEDFLLDREGGNPREQHTWGSQALKQLKKHHDLIDIWRFLNPNKKEFTWNSYYDNIKSRLDRFYISSSLRDFVRNTGISPCS